MFDHLFVRSDELTRQLSALLVNERRRYLTHCAELGMSKRILRVKARLLLLITNTRKEIDQISVIDVSSDIVRLFLRHLEESRKCGVATRNHRLASSPFKESLLRA